MSANEEHHLAFLLGSGISCGVGLDSTQSITKAVFRALEPDQPFRRGLAERSVLAILMKALRAQTRSYRTRIGRPATYNYEDLYFLASSVVDSMIGEFDNAAIEPFIDNLERTPGLVRFLRAGRFLFSDGTEQVETRDRLKLLAQAACELIENVVVESLTKPAERPLDPHAVFKKATEYQTSGLMIFTLNHDLLLEESLRDSGINFMDGFTGRMPELPSLRFWDPRSYDDPGSEVYLLKMHGSLDWWSYPALLVGIAPPCKVDGDPDHVPDPRPESVRHWLWPPDRVLLIGTMNKLLMQARGDHFLDLLCLFRSRLRRCDRLLISGYGFGDKSINGVILDWVARPGNTCVWIVPRPRRALHNARPATAAILRAGLRNQVKVLRAGFQDVPWDDMQAAFETPNSRRDLRWFRQMLGEA